MRTVEIEGGSVTLRERADVKVRQRQMIEAASTVAAPAIAKIPRVEGNPDEIDWEQLDKAGLSLAEMETLQQLQNAAIVALLAGWSFPDPVPRSIDEVLDLPAERYQELTVAVREIGAALATQETSFEASDPNAAGFAETPTAGSTGSEPDSKDAPASEPETAIAQS